MYICLYKVYIYISSRLELFLLAFRFYITSTIKLSTLLIILSKFPFTLRRFIRYYNAWTFIHHLHVMLVNAMWMQHHLHVMLVIFNNGSLCDSLCCVVFRLYSAFSWLIKQLNLFPPWNRFFFFFFFFSIPKRKKNSKHKGKKLCF